jgi:hypothetical protein
MVNHAGHGISAMAVRFAKDRVPTTNKRWKVMNKLLLVASIIALSISAPALAGWGNGNPPHEQPQADDPPNSDDDFGAPGGHGGGGFGTSDIGHTSPNGHTDPSGTNGNQGSDNANPNADNADNGNAGGPGGGGCEGGCEE